ncbi:replication protein [Rhodococcus phenolicus]|uniref:replication protein n=1 Tax=Rhodococcus phenolicus TaxID=263849 RepID=UPI0009EE6A06|nr:replication protein [Rhodococcus phenolicus]
MSQNTLAGGVRRGPRLAGNFTILSNAVINDERLSFRARGILTWLLSKPDDWHTRSESIAAQSPREGRDAVRSALRELAELGYLVREKIQNERGQWSTIQTVYEEPVTGPAPGEPTRGRTDVGQPGALVSTEKPRTKTNRSSRAGKVAHSPAIGRLSTACRAAGLTATFAYLKPDDAAAVEQLVMAQGIPSLVAAAKSVHRPYDPMRFAQAWIPLWRALPEPSATQPKCDICDEFGWLPDDEHGRAVRCGCRIAA